MAFLAYHSLHDLLCLPVELFQVVLSHQMQWYQLGPAIDSLAQNNLAEHRVAEQHLPSSEVQPPVEALPYLINQVSKKWICC